MYSTAEPHISAAPLHSTVTLVISVTMKCLLKLSVHGSQMSAWQLGETSATWQLGKTCVWLLSSAAAGCAFMATSLSWSL